MTHRRVILHGASAGSEGADADPAGLRAAFDAIRVEFDIPAQFPEAVLAQAAQAAASPPHPDRDETGLDFFTIDPPGSMDLDQAMALERDGAGYRVRYAIADVPGFVAPDGALWFGSMFACSTMPTNDQLVEVAALCEGLDIERIFGVTETDTRVLDASYTTDLASRLKALGYRRSFVQYSANINAVDFD